MRRSGTSSEGVATGDAIRRGAIDRIPPEGRHKLVVSRANASARLNEQIQKGCALRDRVLSVRGDLDSAQLEHTRWKDFCAELLRAIFTTSAPADEFTTFYGAMLLDSPRLTPRIR